MWFSDECAFVSNAFSFVPYYMFIVLSVLILLSPVDPAKAAQDFTAYRLTQYDSLDSTIGKPKFTFLYLIGSRTSQISCDVQTISTRTYARRCVMMKLAEVTIESVRTAISNNAGGIIVILPVGGWSEELAEVS